MTLYITQAFVPIGPDSSHGWIQIVTSRCIDRFDTLKRIGPNRCFMHEAVTGSMAKAGSNVRLHRSLTKRAAIVSSTSLS